eukprot:gene4620-14959_t
MCDCEVWQYEFKTRKWQTKQVGEATQPPPRAGHSAVMMEDDNMLVFGGLDNDLWCLPM